MEGFRKWKHIRLVTEPEVTESAICERNCNIPTIAKGGMYHFDA